MAENTKAQKSETTTKAEHDGKTEKVRKEKREFGPVCTTEAELNTHPRPEGVRIYSVTVNGQTRFCYDTGANGAISRCAKAVGMKAIPLGKAPNPERAYAEVMSLPPEELAALVARIQQNAQLPPGEIGKAAKKKAQAS